MHPSFISKVSGLLDLLRGIDEYWLSIGADSCNVGNSTGSARVAMVAVRLPTILFDVQMVNGCHHDVERIGLPFTTKGVQLSQAETINFISTN